MPRDRSICKGQETKRKKKEKNAPNTCYPHAMQINTTGKKRKRLWVNDTHSTTNKTKNQSKKNMVSNTQSQPNKPISATKDAAPKQLAAMHRGGRSNPSVIPSAKAA